MRKFDYVNKKRNGNDKNTNFIMKNNKKVPKKYARIQNSVLYSLFFRENGGHSILKWTKNSRVGTWTISDSDETFPDDPGIHEIRLSWRFQHKLITRSKLFTPQSWHGKLKNRQNKASQAALVHFWVSITVFVLTSKFWNLLHCFCAWRTLR